MTNLSYDNYIELFKSDKKGNPVFCVSLKLKGEGFHRELTNNKRNLWWIIGRTCVLAIITAIVSSLIKIIFF